MAPRRRSIRPENRNRCAGRSTATLAGQTQKEGFVNEIAARIDALLFLAVEGEADTPPTTPVDGQSWLIGKTPTNGWAGHAEQIVSRQGGNWLFTVPIAGMRLFNKALGQDMRWDNGWTVASRPTLPSGGTTVDAESRQAIAAIIEALAKAGIVCRN